MRDILWDMENEAYSRSIDDLVEEERLHKDAEINEEKRSEIINRIKIFKWLAKHRKDGYTLKDLGNESEFEVFDRKGQVIARVIDASNMETRAFLFGYKENELVATARVTYYNFNFHENLDPTIAFRLGGEDEGWTNLGSVRDQVIPLLSTPPNLTALQRLRFKLR